MITSFIDGRVRLRSCTFKHQENVDKIKNVLAAYDGIIAFYNNFKTGSILILYDTEKLSRDDVMFAEQALQMIAPKKTPKASTWSCKFDKRLENRLLAGSLALCLAGSLGLKSVHLFAGLCFSMLAVKHMYERRSTI